MDPVYSGKAFNAFQKDVQANAEGWRGRKVLFLHTGGLLGTYGAASELQSIVEKQGKVERLNVQALLA